MGKYAKLIDELAGGTASGAARDALLKADRRAFGPLVAALANHPNADVREEIAEILGNRKDVAAIPHLLNAVVDSDQYVRMDAIWSIRRILGFEPTAMEELLDLEYSDPKGNKIKIAGFLRKIHVYLKNIDWR